MRIFRPWCSSPQLLTARTLRTLLTLLLAAHLASASTSFDQCDAKEKRCVIGASCHADATKIDPANKLHLVMQKDVKVATPAVPCYDGVEIEIVKTATESAWRIFVAIDPANFVKPVLKLTTDPTTNLDDIVLHGKNEHDTWDINYGTAKLNVMLNALNTISESNAQTFLLTIKDPNGKQISDVLNLVEKDLTVCIAGEPKPDGTPVNDCTAPFYFFTHACDKERLDCGSNDPLCKTVDYGQEDLFAKAKLDCKKHHTLVLDGKPVFDAVECTAKTGWAGNTPAGQAVTVVDFRAAGTDIERKLTATCLSNCDPDLRNLKGGKFDRSVDNQLSCINDKLIMKIKGKVEIRTAATLECVQAIGWKDVTTKATIVSFTEDGAFLDAECVESCTADLIESSCTPEDLTHGCTPPIFNPIGKKFACTDATSVLRIGTSTTFQKFGVQCTRDAFLLRSAPNMPRITFTEPFQAACIAKCHDSYIKRDRLRNCPDPRNIPPHPKPRSECTREGTDPQNGFTTMACIGSEHYIQINSVRSVSASCDPDRGWVTDKNEVAVKFANNRYELEPQCINACDTSNDLRKHRLKQFCAPDVLGEFCTEYIYIGKTYKCPNTHLMRAKGEEKLEMLDEVLTCSREGIKRNKDGSLLYVFDPQNYKSQHNLECVDKCHKTFIDYERSVDHETHKELDCKDTNDVLMISQPLDGSSAPAKRVFGKATCDATGWKHGNTPVAPFTATVHIKAECISVCKFEYLEDACTNPAESRCQKIEQGTFAVSGVLSCGSPAHVLFFNGEEVTGAKCSREGWKHEPDQPGQMLVDNTDAGTTLPPKPSVECRHKCHKNFVENSCVGPDATSGSCSVAKYDEKEGLLTCNDPMEIFVLVNNGNSYESYSESLKCTDGGWMDKENQLVFDPTKFKAEVKCVHVCHVTTLNADASNKRGYQYSDEAKAWKLTCKEQAEMLEFKDPTSPNPARALYSDVQCSKAGWKSINDASGTMLITFTPGAARPTGIAANCVQNKCTNNAAGASRISLSCTGNTDDLCQEPNMDVKYRMSCTAPLVIVKSTDTTGTWYDELVCTDGAWYDLKPATPAKIIPADAPLQVKCSAGACATCEDVLAKIDFGADTNWQQITFAEGKSQTCSSYGCADGAYKIVDASGKATYYPRDPLKKISCSQSKQYVTPDEQREIGPGMKAGCVRKIPCDEHTPLSTTECTGVREGVTCDQNMPALLKLKNNGGVQPPVTCSEDYEMYRFISGDEWEPLKSIVCNAKGGWTATPALESGETVELRKDDRVICADADPNKLKGPAPEPICEACARVLNSQKKKCDECLDKEGDFTYELKGQKCFAKSSTGVITFDADQVQYEPIVCKAIKDKVSGAVTYTWFNEKNQKIGAVAAKLGKPPAAFSKGALAGIIVGCLFVCALVGAGLGYVYYSKKKKAKLIEEQKSKGLTQKIDSIIDEQTVPDDVKTLVL